MSDAVKSYGGSTDNVQPWDRNNLHGSQPGDGHFAEVRDPGFTGAIPQSEVHQSSKILRLL